MAYKYSSPYKVLEQANKAWKVQVGEKVEIISRDRLKPHLGSVDPVAARLPTRGRPRIFCGLSCFRTQKNPVPNPADII